MRGKDAESPDSGLLSGRPRTPPGSGHNLRTRVLGLEFVRVVREHFGAVFGHEDDVLEPDTAVTRTVEPRLDRDDVELTFGLLRIRETKFGKSREVPLHPSTVEALVAFGVAGEDAARDAKGPGSFHVNLYDALAGLDPATLHERARVA